MYIYIYMDIHIHVGIHSMFIISFLRGLVIRDPGPQITIPFKPNHKATISQFMKWIQMANMVLTCPRQIFLGETKLTARSRNNCV